MRHSPLLSILLLALLHHATPAHAEDPADCPPEDAVAPDFTLTDVNETSATHGQRSRLSDHAGEPVLLYFALPTCTHCQQQVEQLQEIRTAEADSRLAGVWVAVIAQRGDDEGLPDLTDGADLPILLDESGVDVFGLYSASRWYIYLLDRQHIPRAIHYAVDLDSQRDLLLDQIAAIAQEGR